MDYKIITYDDYINDEYIYISSDINYNINLKKKF